jgi:DNA-binding NarL/FixJ family response regulator
MSSENVPAGKKVLIVEDHPIVSDSLFRLVSESFDNIICIHASTGSKGLAYLNSNHFDIVLLDINLPDISGIEFCSQAKARFPELKILAVTSLAQRHVIEKSFEAGMNGFVLKTSDIKDITDGIKEVIAGNKYLGKGVKELISNRPSSNSSDPIITRRESEILKLIADGFTNQEIADKLFISTSTVDSHRKNLLIKFDAKNTASLIKSAMEKGII